ncbi:lipid-A-disaccharide synthase N-terminal domain-containing protein [Alphaproteobacteria bacterium]|nr:lipid-A-disaccharide synthase N-terminal domain-containing protein [Alphaproteobacteria bacterium]
MLSVGNIWLIVGFIGQGMFASRFWFQWIASERQKKSIIPVIFWYLSIAGGLILLTYAIYREDPVFIVGQSTGLLIYSRNLYFIYRERKKNIL